MLHGYIALLASLMVLASYMAGRTRVNCTGLPLSGGLADHH